MKTLFLVSIIACFGILLVVLEVEAIPWTSEENMALGADVIAVGRIVSYQDDGAHRYYEISIIKWIKNPQVDQTITMRSITPKVFDPHNPYAIFQKKDLGLFYLKSVDGEWRSTNYSKQIWASELSDTIYNMKKLVGNNNPDSAVTLERACKEGYVNAVKNRTGEIACVKPQTLQKLRERGWAEPLGDVVSQKPSQAIQDLAEKSDRIISGVVTDIETIGNTTQVWIGIYEWLKKSPNHNSIILDIPQGSAESELDFQKGEEMLLFLKDIDLANGHFGIFYLDDKTRPTKYSLFMREDVASFVKPEDKEPYYMYQQNENCESLVLENDSFLYCTYPEEEFRYYIPILKTADRVKQKMLQYVSERYFAEHFDLRRAYDNAVVNGHTVPTGQDFEFNYKLGNQSFLYLVHVFGDDKEAYIAYSPPKEIQTLVDENKITELIQSCVGEEAYPIIWDKAMVSRDEKGFTPVITGGTPAIYDRYGNAVLHPTKQQFRAWPETGEVECAKEMQDFALNPILPQKRELLIDSTEFLKVKNRK